MASARVVGVFATLSLAQREKKHLGEWSLVREPDNAFDAHAVAVHIGSLKIGYLSGAKAKAYSSGLDALGGSWPVTGSQDGIVFHVDLPDLAEFRKSR